MIDGDLWEVLERGAPAGHVGTASRRVAPSSGHDLFIGVRYPARRRQIFLEVPLSDWPSDAQLPEFKSLEASVEVGATAVRAIVELLDPALNDVFTALANDVVQQVSRAQTRSVGVLALIERLGRWRRLLEPESGGGMTREEQRGLFGELLVLRRAIHLGATPESVVESWVGPLEANQDFQFPKVALEVKTTAAKQPQALKISNERQLDTTGVEKLLLVHVSVDERQHGSGTSLPEMISEARVEVGTQMLARFDGLLTAYGWLPGSELRYQQPLYSVRSVDAFHVREGFPRITEADIPTGGGSVEYLVQLGAMVEFETELDPLLADGN